MEVIKANELVKNYGRVRALDKVSFALSNGEVLSVLGPNGSGKTTLLNIVVGVSEATSGTISVLGGDPRDQRVKSLVGFMPQEDSLYDELSGIENLEFYGGLYGLPRKLLTERARRLLADVGLKEWGKKKVKTYSGGMRKRLSLAIALINDPQILVLDEPTTGLDPVGRRHVLDVVREARRRRKAVLLATHYMEEAEQLSDRVLIMFRGKVLVEGSPKDLIVQYASESVINVELAGDEGKAGVEAIGGLGLKAYEVRQDSKSIIKVLSKDPDKDLPLVIKALHDAGLKVKAIIISKPSLEEVFIKLTGRGLGDEGQ